MEEVDQILARVFRTAGPRPAAGPEPAPASGPFPPPVASGPHRAAAAGPGPHFAIAPAPEPIAAALRWPDTVLTLEHQHGDRFAQLAGALIETARRQLVKVVLFTSCHRAEGRTTLVLTLARALARWPVRTVLVDADLNGPMVARQLGLRPRVGLDDVIEDGLAPAAALIDSPDDHLTLLPLRAPVARPREFLASPAWSCLMARLRREFDLVLLDGSPLFAGLSAAVLHRSVDAAVLVHHRGLTGERALLRAREVLDAGGVPLLGLAETFV